MPPPWVRVLCPQPSCRWMSSVWVPSPGSVLIPGLIHFHPCAQSAIATSWWGHRRDTDYRCRDGKLVCSLFPDLLCSPQESSPFHAHISPFPAALHCLLCHHSFHHQLPPGCWDCKPSVPTAAQKPQLRKLESSSARTGVGWVQRPPGKCRAHPFLRRASRETGSTALSHH